MNSQLDGQVFPIPPNVLVFLKQQPEVSSIDRNKHLLDNGMVSYGQLKRILHDMKYLDKKTEMVKYNQYGGQPMEDWGKSILKQNRDTIKNTKQSKKIADDISGDRKNAFNKTHTNSMSAKIGVNDVSKPNSEKWSGSSQFSADSMKLTESINRIKKLIKWQQN